MKTFLKSVWLRGSVFSWDLFHPRQARKIGKYKRRLRAEAKRLQRTFRDVPEEQGKVGRAKLCIAGAKKDFGTNVAAVYLKKKRFHRTLTTEEEKLEIRSLDQLRGCMGPLLHIQYQLLEEMRKVAPTKSLDEAVEHTLDLLTQQTVAARDLVFQFRPVSCSRFEVLVCRPGEDNFFGRLREDLENARSHINIAMYGIRDENGEETSTANRIAHLLEEKAKRGLEVNFLFDAFGTGLWGPRENEHCRNLMGRMSKQGVRCVYNNPWNIRDMEQFLRMDHRKLYVIDGNVAYVGGMGIEDQFENDGPEKICHDVMARLEGDVVKQFQCAFLDSFAYQMKKGNAQTAFQIEGDRDSLRNRYFPKRVGHEGTLKATCLTNIPVAGTRQISDCYIQMIAKSAEHVYVMNPYCSEDDVAEALKRAAKRYRVSEKVWTSGLTRPQGALGLFPDGRMGESEEATKRCEFPGLLKAGLKILLYDKGWLHGKVAVQDNRKVVVGSCNIDVFSLTRNWEIAVCVEDEGVASYVIDEIFKRDEPPESHLAPRSFSIWKCIKYAIMDALDRLL